MPLPTEYQSFIHLTNYGRWLEDEGRRETWEETVNRYLTFWKVRYPEVKPAVWHECFDYIAGLQVMPSMRALMTAGPALDKHNVAGYNCAFATIDSVQTFAEFVYILMCGTGVGFSVERQFIKKLPDLPESLFKGRSVIFVEDSKLGWAAAFRNLLSLLYNGEIPKWDTSEIRPKGARLKTFGGRASGPGPLEDLFQFTVGIFKRAIEDDRQHLSSLDCHDISCKIGQAVISGGVRRSAMLSLSNLSDSRMQKAKYGNWQDNSSWRSYANNSAAYTERPSMNIFLDEWNKLIESKSGERGIYNVRAAQNQAARNGRRDENYHFGTNPCSEIILRDKQFCNLTEVVVRPSDTFENLSDKVRIATLLGTLQSTLTKFRFLRYNWKANCEDERLLGVSLTGIMDNSLTNNWEDEDLPFRLEELRDVAIETNRTWAKRIGISQSTAITCVKPSGTVSQLVNSANGIHPRYAKFYIRRVEIDKKDPIHGLLQACGFPGKDHPNNEHSYLFEFPMYSPEGAVLRDDVTALEQLELWSIYHEHWCEHKPSQTINVRDEEWLEVGAWVYRSFHLLSGISFFPYQTEDTVYKGITPYEEITELEYKRLLKLVPKVNWSRLSMHENEDNTTVKTELACSAESCEV